MKNEKMAQIKTLFEGRFVAVTTVENSYFSGILDVVKEDHVILRLAGRSFEEAKENGELLLIDTASVRRVGAPQPNWPMARNLLEQAYNNIVAEKSEKA